MRLVFCCLVCKSSPCIVNDVTTVSTKSGDAAHISRKFPRAAPGSRLKTTEEVLRSKRSEAFVLIG